MTCAQLSSSCNEGHRIENRAIIEIQKIPPPYHLDLEKYVKETKSIPLSTIGNEIHYIPLETNHDCLIRNIKKVLFSKSFIFVNDFDYLFQFDIKGKFIRKIGQKGKGPGEYGHVFDFCIDYVRDRVYIIDYKPRIHEFNFNGNYIRTVNRERLESHQFLMLDSSRLIFHIANVTESVDPNIYSLIITDLYGNQLTKLENFNKRKSKMVLTLPNPPCISLKTNCGFRNMATIRYLPL